MHSTWHNNMRAFFLTWLFGGLLLMAAGSSLPGQTTPPVQPGQEKTEPKSEPKAQPKTDETTYVIPYGLAAVAVVVVMVLVCTPARRE